MSRLTAGQGRNLFTAFRRGINRYEPRPSKWTGFEFYIDMVRVQTNIGTLSITLPTVSTGTYNCTVDWGDGSTDAITVWNQAQTTHTYATAALFRIRITGTFTGFNSGSTRGSYLEFREGLILITQFGPNFALVNSSPAGGYFSQLYNLVEVGSNLDLTGPNGTITALANLFANCNSLIGVNCGSWTVSPIQMQFAFQDCWLFRGRISNWNVSNVAGSFGFRAAFQRAYYFNHNLSTWAMSGATNYLEMFDEATSYNQSIGSYNFTVAGSSLQFLLRNAYRFDQDIAGFAFSSTSVLTNMLDYCGMSVENYSRALIIMANYASTFGPITNRNLGAAGLKYNGITYPVDTDPYFNAVDARAYLISQGWTITDAGQV